MATLLIAGAIANRIGLPRVLTDRIVASVRERGLKLEFTRARLSWRHGLVVDNLRLASTNLHGPQLFVGEARLRVSLGNLADPQLRLRNTQLRDGRLFWRLTQSNQPPQTLLVDRIQGRMHLRDPDEWEVTTLQADALGIGIRLSGTLSNASGMRAWRLPQKPLRAPGAAENRIHRLLTEIGKVALQGEPRLDATFQGDAIHPRQLKMDLTLNLPAVESPWLTSTNLLLTASLLPANHDDQLPRLEIQGGTARVRSPWGEAARLQIDVSGSPSPNQLVPTNIQFLVRAGGAATPWAGASHLVLEGTLRPSVSTASPELAETTLTFQSITSRWGRADRLLVNARLSCAETNPAVILSTLSASATRLETPWGSAERTQLRARGNHSVSNLWPAVITSDIRLEEPRTPWGQAMTAELQLATRLPPRAQLILLQTNLPWSDRLAKWSTHGRGTASRIQSPRLNIDSALVLADWEWPRLQLQTTNQLYGGELAAATELNTQTSELLFSMRSSFDAQQIVPWLTDKGRHLFEQYSWSQPPQIEASGRLTLPDWTNGPPEDWPKEVLPTVSLAGQLRVGAGAFRAVAFDSAQSPFSLTNMIWHMPALVVTRPEGAIEAAYTSDQRTQDFHWRVFGQFDPLALKPLCKTDEQRRGFDWFQFASPPRLEGEVWGRWREPDRVGATVHVWATNLTFRGEPVAACSSAIYYSNKFLAFIQPWIRRSEGEATASLVTVDLGTKLVALTNASGNLDPHAVARAIGPKTGLALVPYQFESAPQTRVNGIADARKGGDRHDLHFRVDGGRFHWQVFHLDQAGADLYWQGKHLLITNVGGLLHGGQVQGEAQFDFSPSNRVDFSFRSAVTNGDLKAFLVGFVKPTNRLEGTVSGVLVVTNANSHFTNSWQGYGTVSLRDGLIWDLPLFSIFSPILNTILPGLGNSRARDASATFVISNSVIWTTDMQIEATGTRMQYQGRFGFDRSIQGRMQAELLRNVPGVGLLVSRLFWPVTKLFDYRVSGTFLEPKAEPIYIIPKLLALPFLPFRIIEEIVTPPRPPPAHPPPSPDTQPPG